MANVIVESTTAGLTRAFVYAVSPLGAPLPQRHWRLGLIEQPRFDGKRPPSSGEVFPRPDPYR